MLEVGHRDGRVAVPSPVLREFADPVQDLSALDDVQAHAVAGREDREHHVIGC